jgi:hypothetical protein
MSPWLFNIFMDGVIKEMKVRTMHRGIEMNNSGHTCTISSLLFADDTVLSDSEQRLQELVSEFERVCARRKLRVDVNKSKVMRICKSGGESGMNITISENRMEEVNCFRYLGVDFSANGRRI